MCTTTPAVGGGTMRRLAGVLLLVARAPSAVLGASDSYELIGQGWCLAKNRERIHLGADPWEPEINWKAASVDHSGRAGRCERECSRLGSACIGYMTEDKEVPMRRPHPATVTTAAHTPRSRPERRSVTSSRRRITTRGAALPPLTMRSATSAGCACTRPRARRRMSRRARCRRPGPTGARSSASASCMLSSRATAARAGHDDGRALQCSYTVYER